MSLHEFGHLTISKLYDCEYGKIIYEDNLPHTEILCQDLLNDNAVILGGILVPFILALLFFFAGGKFMKEISFLIFGFSIIISYVDIIDLGFSENISIFATILGMLSIILGIGLLAKSRTQENELIYFK